MAINLGSEFVGKVGTATPDYPTGVPRNVSAPGAGDGTPWDEKLIKDFVGFRDAALLRAGLTANNLPETANSSQILDGLRDYILGEALRTVDSLVDLLDIPFLEGAFYQNNGFYPDATVGGGTWKAVSGADLTQNNGGTIVSKAALQAWKDAAVAAGGVTTANLQANLNVLFTAGTGTGDAFVRIAFDSLNLSMFGGAFAGVDDSQSMKAMLQYHADTGIPVHETSGNDIRVATSVQVDTFANKNLELNFGSSKITCENAGIQLAKSDSMFLTTSLAVEPEYGNTYIDVVDATGVQVGDLMEIDSPALSQGSVNTLHYYPVMSIEGNRIWVDGFVVADINSQQIIDSGQTGSIAVRFYRMSGNLNITNMRIEMIDDNGAVTAFLPKHFNSVNADKIYINGNGRNGFYPQHCCYVNISNSNAFDYGYVDKDQGYASVPSSPDGFSFGYGFISARNYSFKMNNCEGGRGWHLCDISRGTIHAVMDNCHSNKDGYGFSTHEGAWFVTWFNCTTRGGLGFITDRAIYPKLVNCKCIQPLQNGVTISPSSHSAIVDGFEGVGWYSSTQTSSLIYGIGSTSSPQPKAGALSAKLKRKFHYKDISLSGNCRTNFTGTGTDGDGSSLIIENVYVDSCSIYGIYLSQFNTIKNIELDGETPYRGLSFEGSGSAGTRVINIDDVRKERGGHGINAQVLYLKDANDFSGNKSIHNIRNCVAYQGSALIGGNTGQEIRIGVLANNYASLRLFVVDSATVDKAINNARKTSDSGTITYGQEVGTIVLT